MSHGGTSAHETPLFPAPPESFDLLFKLPEFQHFIEFHEQHVHGKRLDEEIEGADFHGPDRLVDGRVGGHHQRLPMRLPVQYLVQDIEAIGIGELNILEHQIETLLGDGLQSLCSVSGQPYLVPLLFQGLAHQVAQQVVVLHHQQLSLDQCLLLARMGS